MKSRKNMGFMGKLGWDLDGIMGKLGWDLDEIMGIYEI